MSIKIGTYNITWILRYWLGAIMMYHSYWAFFNKEGLSGFSEYLDNYGFPAPFLLAIIAKAIEFGGGFLLIMGIATRIVSLLIGLVMIVAVFIMHKGLFWSEGELAFNYLLLSIVLFLNPKDEHGLVHLIKKNFKR